MTNLTDPVVEDYKPEPVKAFSIPNAETKGKIINKNGLKTVSAIILLVVIFSWVYLAYTNYLNRRNTSLPSTNVEKLPIESTPRSQPLIQDYEISATPFNSPSSKYTLTFYGPTVDGETVNGSGTCTFKLFNNDLKKEIDLSKLLGVSRMWCDNGMGGFYSSFKQWGGDEKMIFILYGDRTSLDNAIKAESKITIVDLVNDKVSEWEYDSDKYAFESVDKDLRHFVLGLRESRTYPTSFVVQDYLGNTLKTINFPFQDSDFATISYDAVNNGFLFTYHLLDEAATKIAEKEKLNVGNGLYMAHFDYLTLPELNMKSLLITDPHPVYGYGCPRGSPKFTNNTIIEGGESCLQIDQKYFNNGVLTIKINQ